MPPDKNFYQICYFEGKYKENLNILFKHSNIFLLSVTVYLNFLFLSLLFSPPNLFIDFVLYKLKTRLYWEKSKFQKNHRVTSVENIQWIADWVILQETCFTLIVWRKWNPSSPVCHYILNIAEISIPHILSVS